MTTPGPIFVAGMHRSGTSLFASVLAAAGVDMGERLLAGDRHNRPGYFEDLAFLDLDRRMLVEAVPDDDGGHPDWGWTEGERLDRARFETHRDEARALLAARPADRPWGFKDPRATLLLDFWLSLAPDARFLLPYRLPWDVADSMQRLGAPVFLRRPDYAARIWAFYNRHLLDFHRRHPERSLLVSLDAAVGDSARFAALLGERLGIEARPEVLAERFDAALLDRLPAGDPLVPLWRAAHPESAEVLAALDAEAELPASGLWNGDPPRAAPAAAEPLVAIVVPCYDDGVLAIEAVASVERVVGVPYELVVVDDGSTAPRTGRILDVLAAAGYEVHRRPHAGVAATRNHGFSSTRAPYVLPLDADNLLLPGFVAAALEALERHPEVGAAYGDRVEFGLRDGRVEVAEFDPDLLAAGNYVDACALIRRAAWEKAGGYDERMPAQGWEDWDLWLGLVSRRWPLLRLPIPGFAYRVRPSSMLHQLDDEGKHSALRSYLLAKHQELYFDLIARQVAAVRAARMGRDGDGVELECARFRLAASERRHHELAEEAARFERALAVSEHQRQHLHAYLEQWRSKLTEEKTPRSVRLRRHAVRLRSRVERRPQTGPAIPCVIGATGGSGTRVFARIAAAGGLWIGAERNEFEDALPIERFLDRWIMELWAAGGWQPPYPSPPGMDDDFAAVLAEQLAAPAGARGWKSPRSLYVLPFLAQRFPDLRFLHVVRDGRDMALSANQWQLARYGDLMLPPDLAGRTDEERSIALWSRINLLAADYGERLGSAYLRVRFEDLCTEPERMTRRVFRFFALPGNARQAARQVLPPASLGRWRSADPALVARLEGLAGDALARLGYGASPRG